ncbi:hypothetical protein XENORESO_009657 [Xenotaenia resolanae]|uniref:Uncharacterized protein n=1 Tax=Xenotaenia resolanae TaxID=208358 RepID=A0ABV0WA72_9TELE
MISTNHDVLLCRGIQLGQTGCIGLASDSVAAGGDSVHNPRNSLQVEKLAANTPVPSSWAERGPPLAGCVTVGQSNRESSHCLTHTGHSPLRLLKPRSHYPAQCFLFKNISYSLSHTHTHTETYRY